MVVDIIAGNRLGWILGHRQVGMLVVAPVEGPVGAGVDDGGSTVVVGEMLGGSVVG